MATFSGKNGKVFVDPSDLTDCQNWTLNLESNNPEFGGTANAGHKTSVDGVKRSSGSFELKVDKEDPVYDRIKPGQAVTLELYEDATRKWSVPARIENIELTSDQDEGEAFSASVSFSPRGAWTYPDGTVSE